MDSKGEVEMQEASWILLQLVQGGGSRSFWGAVAVKMGITIDFKDF